jgi:hypothetical protein
VRATSKAKALPSAQLLGAHLRYEPETGHFFWSKHPHPAKQFKNGKRADIADSLGYRVICFDKKQYKAHRVAWYLSHGAQPDEIDHINGDRSDNRFANLRSVPHRVNCSNRHARLAKAGAMGVWPSDRKFRATITVNYRRLHLGVFDSVRAASDAYQNAWRRLVDSGL